MSERPRPSRWWRVPEVPPVIAWAWWHPWAGVACYVVLPVAVWALVIAALLIGVER